MNPQTEQTNSRRRRLRMAPQPLRCEHAIEPPAATARTRPRRRESESGLNLKPSGRTTRPSAGALEDRSTQTGGQTVGQIAVENPVFSCRDVNVFYGSKHALKKVNIDVGRKQVLAMIGPSGCGKSTFLRCLNRMNDTIPGARVTGSIKLDGSRHPRQAAGRRAAARPCRHGVPEAQSVSEIDLRERRLRPAHSRPRPRPRRSRRDRLHEPAARRPVGRGEGSLERAGHRPVGRSAAAPVHRAHHRRFNPK